MLSMVTLFSLSALAQGILAQAFCSTYKEFCLYSHKKGDDIYFDLQIDPNVDLGWVAFGFGKGMLNSEVYVAGVDIKRNVSLSRRSITTFASPKVDGITQDYTIQNATLNAKGYLESLLFSRPIRSTPVNGIIHNAAKANISMIWAIGTPETVLNGNHPIVIGRHDRGRGVEPLVKLTSTKARGPRAKKPRTRTTTRRIRTRTRTRLSNPTSTALAGLKPL